MYQQKHSIKQYITFKSKFNTLYKKQYEILLYCTKRIAISHLFSFVSGAVKVKNSCHQYDNVSFVKSIVLVKLDLSFIISCNSKESY